MRLLTKLHILILFCLLSANVSAEREATSPQEIELVEAVSENFVTLAERLISENVAVDITDNYGQSLLMFAAKNDNKELVKLLIKKGANPNYKIDQKASYNQDKNMIRMMFLKGLMVLDYGVMSKSVAMVDLLMELGAKLDVENDDLNSSVAKASQRNNLKMVRYLLSKGAKVSDKTGQFLVVWHIIMDAEPVYGTTKITRNTDFSLIKLWHDYGIPLDYESLTSFEILRTSRDRQNIINYMEAYREWLADGAKVSQEAAMRQQSAEPTFYTKTEAEMDSIMAAAQYRADNHTTIGAGEVLEKRQNKIKNWTVIFVVLALLITAITQRHKILALWQTYSNKRSASPPFVSSPNSIVIPNVSPVNKTTDSQIRNNGISKNKKNSKHIAITEKGWIDDDTMEIKVNYLTIEDMINPIRMKNEHERAVREMIWYIRRLERLSDEEASTLLGPKGLQPKLEKLRVSIKSTNVRDVYKRSLYVLVEHYSQRDKQVQTFLEKTQWGK